MQGSAQHLREIKKKIEEALIDKGFTLESFIIEVEEDDNHTAHLRLRLLPEALKDEDDLQIDQAFTDIIKGMGL
jgi:DNA mismatch repair ATPase MutL